MAFSVNGITFTPGSAFDHATNQLNYINGLLQGLSLPTLQPNNGNALWWTLLGQGSFDAQLDNMVIQASNSLNVANTDDNQIINLLPVAGTSLIPPSASALTLTFTATSGILSVPSGTIVPYGAYNFYTLTPLTVPASGSANVVSLCQTLGPITIPVGVINLTSLTPSLPNFGSVVNNFAAIPGTLVETPAQARTRVLQGKTIGVGIDGCITALRLLPGVGQANVFMNPGSSQLIVSGLAFGIPGGCAYIVVQGPSPNIGITYLQYMTMPTSGTNFAPSQVQGYTTQAGQNFPVYYDFCTYQQIFATVYVDANKTLQNGYANIVQNALTSLNGTFQIGQRVSSEQVLNAFPVGFNPCTILGLSLATSIGGTYGQAVQPSINSIPYFTASGILIVLQ